MADDEVRFVFGKLSEIILSNEVFYHILQIYIERGL